MSGNKNYKNVPLETEIDKITTISYRPQCTYVELMPETKNNITN